MCNEMLLDHLSEGSTRELFARCVRTLPDDPVVISDAIQEIDFAVKDSLEVKLQRNLMDKERHRGSVFEELSFRLRLENAVACLSLFQRSEPTLQFGTEIDELALLWPLTTLWKVSRIHWACRTADAFLQGQESALPIRL